MTEVLSQPHSTSPEVQTRTPQKINGVVIGVLMGLDKAGAPLVSFAANPQAEAVPARATAPLSRRDVGRQVALLFEGGDPARPLIIGPIHHPETALEANAEESPSVEIDGERILLHAHQEIVLRCGKASITLTKAGKILIRGAYLLSRSSGANRIKGGSVQIN